MYLRLYLNSEDKCIWDMSKMNWQPSILVDSMANFNMKTRWDNSWVIAAHLNMKILADGHDSGMLVFNSKEGHLILKLLWLLRIVCETERYISSGKSKAQMRATNICCVRLCFKLKNDPCLHQWLLIIFYVYQTILFFIYSRRQTLLKFMYLWYMLCDPDTKHHCIDNLCTYHCEKWSLA